MSTRFFAPARVIAGPKGLVCVVLPILLYRQRSGLFHVSSWLVSCVSGFVRRLATKVLDLTRRRVIRSHHALRECFRSTILPRADSYNPSHSHPSSGAVRSSCMTLAMMLCHQLGMKPYSYQGSNVDAKDGIAMSRDYYWMKDVQVPSKNDPILNDNLVVIVDVDYYLDVAALLLTIEQPVLLYTFQPTAVASANGEFSFCFNKNNEIEYQVSGGAKYCHSVWHYGIDFLTVSSWFKTKTFLVDRRKADDHHEYVFLIPVAGWFAPFSWLANWLSTDCLERVRVVHGDFAMLDIQTKDGRKRSVARLGDYNCATIAVDTFDAIAAASRHSSNKVTHATMQSWVEGNRHSASVLLDYFRSSQQDKPFVVFPAVEGVRVYQIIGKYADYDPTERGYMVSFMSPVLPEAFVPAKVISNERAAVEGRLLKPSIEAKELAGMRPSKFLVKEMERFVEFLIPVQNQLDPYELDEVYSRQARPSQRQLFDQSDSAVSKHFCKTFVKAETYQKPADPRIITTYDTVDKREYSRYVYALSDLIIKQRWYAFGKNPLEIAQIVGLICANSSYVNCADASRMDGHVEETVRRLERMILLRLFKVVHHQTIIGLHSAQYGVKAATTLGVKYNIDHQRGSGSPETAVMNTIITKFIDYLSRRLGRFTPIEAYDSLGLFGGDDSIASGFADNYAGSDEIVKAGAMIGQKIENVVFVRGDIGVNFLSRFYGPNVWYGDINSVCDIPRILGKIHTSPNLAGFTPLEKLRQKLIGLSLTDSNTPIVGDIVSAARRLGLLNDSVDLERKLVSWWAQYDLEVNWPNDIDLSLVDWVSLMIPHADYSGLIQYLTTIKHAHQLLTMPVIADPRPPEIKSPMVVVDDHIHTKTAANNEQICKRFLAKKCSDRDCKYKHTRVCFDYVKGQCKRKQCKFAHVQA